MSTAVKMKFLNMMKKKGLCISDKRKHRIDYIYSKNGKGVTLVPTDSHIINKYQPHNPNKNRDNWVSDHNAVLTRFTIYICNIFNV